MHSDLLALDSICAVSLNRHLCGGRGAEKGVCKNRPGVAVPVVGDRLDQIAVGCAHADPERGIAGAATGSLGQNKGGSGLPNPGARANGTGAESWAHGSLNRDGSGEDGKNLAERRHIDLVERVTPGQR